MAFQSLDRFQAFAPDLQHHRPRWQQVGATHFVTFRLVDALSPAAKGRLADPRYRNTYETFLLSERHLDSGKGACLFRNPANAEVVISAMRHFDGVRYHLGGFVVMPNHVHAILQPLRPYTTAAIVEDWKSYTAHILRLKLHLAGKLWHAETFERLVCDDEELQKYHHYINTNPAAAGLKPGSFSIGRGAIDVSV
jgi:REP element-mobilizing transposase RayT